MAWFFKNRKTNILSPLEGYNSWAPFYLRESNPVKDLSDNLIEKYLPDLHGKRVLDAGCGPGKFCVLAEKQHALTISGIDLSPNMIEQARKNCPSGNFKCDDLSQIAIEEKAFDVMICALVPGHLQNLSPALDNLLKALDHGGIFIMTDFHPFLTLMQSKRTFTNPVSGQHFEIRHYLHFFEEYFKIFVKYQVIIEDWAEPLYNGVPLVFAVRLKKM